MTHHIVVSLPGDRVACADYRDPVARAMRRVLNKIASNMTRNPYPGSPEDYRGIALWLDAHEDLSESCRAGFWPGMTCIHDEDPGTRAVLLPGGSGMPEARRASAVVGTFAGADIRSALEERYGFTPEAANAVVRTTAAEMSRRKQWKVPQDEGFIILSHISLGSFTLEEHLEKPRKGVDDPERARYSRAGKGKTPLPIQPERKNNMPVTRGRPPAPQAAPAPALASTGNGNGHRDVDYSKYLSKSISPTMLDFVEWFEDNVADLDDVPVDKILVLGSSLYPHFCKSDFGISRREERRASVAPVENSPQPLRRGPGRPRKVTPPPELEPEPTPEPKRRGRPPKAQAAPPPEPEPIPAPKRRGRPPKVQAPPPPPEPEPRRGPGRPRKVQQAHEPEPEYREPPRRGRPPKVTPPPAPEPEYAPEPRRRGRPPRAAAQPPPPPVPEPPRRRGRPPKSSYSTAEAPY